MRMAAGMRLRGAAASVFSKAPALATDDNRELRNVTMSSNIFIFLELRRTELRKISISLDWN
jgi:hypothetical protein